MNTRYITKISLISLLLLFSYTVILTAELQKNAAAHVVTQK